MNYYKQEFQSFRNLISSLYFGRTFCKGYKDWHEFSAFLARSQTAGGKASGKATGRRKYTQNLLTLGSIEGYFGRRKFGRGENFKNISSRRAYGSKRKKSVGGTVERLRLIQIGPINFPWRFCTNTAGYSKIPNQKCTQGHG